MRNLSKRDGLDIRVNEAYSSRFRSRICAEIRDRNPPSGCTIVLKEDNRGE